MFKIKNSLHLQVGCVRQEQQPAKLGEQLSLFLSIYPARMRFGQYGQKKKIFFLLLLQLRRPFFPTGWTTQILFTSIHTNFRMKRKIKIIKSEREERKRKKERDRGKMELGEKEMGCGGIISYCSRISIIQHINTQRCEERFFFFLFFLNEARLRKVFSSQCGGRGEFYIEKRKREGITKKKNEKHDSNKSLNNVEISHRALSMASTLVSVSMYTSQRSVLLG